MKIRFLVFSLHVVVAVGLAQSPAPLGSLLQAEYPALSSHEDAVVWIYFRDKGSDAEQRLASVRAAIANGMRSTSIVSDRSLNRRLKTRAPDNAIDLEDLPLNRSYVQAVAGLVNKIRYEVSWFNAVSAEATKQQMEVLRRLPFVRGIELVVRLRKRNEDVENTATGSSAPSMPDQNNFLLYNYGSSLTQNQQINVVAVHNLGITGQGVLIGVFDAGFSNLSHPAIATRPIVARYDFVANSPTLGSHSHGQGTFSVIGGYSEGNLIGPAFGASFVLARTENDPASETPIEEDNWVRAIIWADSIGIDVASTSLGYLTYDSPWPSYTWQSMNGSTAIMTCAADRAVDLGIVVVNSAGNEGYNSTRNTLIAPADGFNVIAAGGVTTSGTRASFSSVGPTADGRTKPDVMALGSGVWAASGTSSYGSVSGTSFSCPLSAGVAALVLSANPGLAPLQVREAMRQTASRASNPDREYGWGILDALKAVNYAWIEHTPLTNAEDTTARTVVVKIRSRVPVVADSTRVIFGVNGDFSSSALLQSTGSPNEYSAQIPYFGSGVNVCYYIKARNSYVSTRLPLGAPGQFFSYQVRRDLVGPSTMHRALGNQSIVSWPSEVSAIVQDTSGVDSVKVEYMLNGQPQEPFVLRLVDSASVFADTFHIGRDMISPSDTIAYRVLAKDRSNQANVSTYPYTGYFRFAIVNYANASASFDSDNGGFTATNDWQWGAPQGTSPPVHSAAKYWGTNLAGNYMQGPRLSSLQSPTYSVFSSRSTFSIWHWHEIQSNFDGGNVKISLNGGPFQTIQPVGGYPISTIYSGFGNPLGGQAGISGVGGTQWSKLTFDLAGIVNEGSTIAVRFDFGVDNGIQYRGWYIDDFTANGFGTALPASADSRHEFPQTYCLEQNYPNPFNPSTTIEFSVAHVGHVRLVVYDVLGRAVATLVDGIREPGSYRFVWEAADLSSGIYFYRLTAGKFVQTKKLLLVR